MKCASAILSPVYFSALLFFTLSHKRQAIEKVTKYKKCIRFSLQLLSEIFLILRRNEEDMITNLYWSSCKVLLFLSDFNET